MRDKGYFFVLTKEDIAMVAEQLGITSEEEIDRLYKSAKENFNIGDWAEYVSAFIEAYQDNNGGNN